MDEDLTRRRFLKLTGAAGAGLGLAYATGGCAGPVRSAPNPEYVKLPHSAKRGKVVLGLYRSQNFRAIAEEVLPQITDLKWLRPGDKVFLKVACNSGNRHPAVTSPWSVRTMVELLRDRGARVIVGDQSGVEFVRRTAERRVRSTRELMRKNGLLRAIRASGATLHCFDDQGWDGYFQPPENFANHWQRQIWLPKILREVDHVVYLPRLSAHALAGYTCAIKIAVGWLRDDSRRLLHQKGGRFFERIAEINHCTPLREKLRFTLILGEQALLNIGPDIGSKYDFKGCLALGSQSLVDADYLASQLVPWFDRQQSSVFDLYSPYPKHVNFWNKRFVAQVWGSQAAKAYEPITSFPLGKPLEYDACISHLARLQGYRPKRIEVVRRGDRLPKPLLAHLERAGGGIFAS